MKVLLINVDCKWNLAIRRLYAWYSKRDDVTMIDIGFRGYPHKKSKIIDASGYDKVYVSNIFEVNSHNVIVTGCNDVDYGGIGSRNPTNKLPDYIDSTPPFYYDNEDTSYGFITRGCIRNCWFCKVRPTEGELHEYNSVDDIIKHDKVVFMDNNILAYDKHMDVLKHLVELNVKCTFKQGLDFRLLTEENMELLSKLRYMDKHTFAFDDISYKPLLDEKIVLIKKYVPQPWRVKFYIYYNPSMDLNTLISRAEWCRHHECLPYVMRDKSCWDVDVDMKNFLIDYTAYCNQPSVFAKMSFDVFLNARYKNKDRIESSLEIYNHHC